MRSLPNLSVQQLEYLVAVHDAPTWADAAATVGVTPSALSQGLAETETPIGGRALERDGRRRVPTEAARRCPRGRARRSLLSRRTRPAGPSSAEPEPRGGVRVGMIDAAATIHCAAGLAAFRAERPEVALHLQVSPSGELLRDLAAARLDVVVCVAPAVLPEGVTATRLLEEDLAVYAPVEGRPRAWGPWVTYPVGSQTRELVLDALRRAGRRSPWSRNPHNPDVLRKWSRWASDGRCCRWCRSTGPMLRGPRGRRAIRASHAARRPAGGRTGGPDR